MIGFLIKKSFFDLWDNIFRVALINLGFIASASIPAVLPTFLGGEPLAAGIVLVVGVLWCFVYLAASAAVLRRISDYGAFGFADFFGAFKTMWLPGLVLGVVCLLLAFFATTALPFYFTMNGFIGVLAAALVFWAIVIALLALQYFFPIRSRLDTDLRKVFKKSFIVFFDNPGFSIFLAIANLVGLAVSCVLAFLLPGPAGMILFLDQALRLRLMKYDYLEAHPDANRRKIPWDELLAEDRENTGSRSFKSFIFPWKD